MARIAPDLLDLARYPFRHAMTTRFADMDANKHINNVAMATAVEDARYRFSLALDMPRYKQGMRIMLIANSIDYLAEAHYPDPIDLFVGVLHIGRTSWTLACIAAQGGRPCCFSRSVAVYAGESGAAPIPDPIRASLAQARLRDAAEPSLLRSPN